MRTLSKIMLLLALLGLILVLSGCSPEGELSEEDPPITSEPTLLPALVGANYYPWYDYERWETEGYTNSPWLGKYDSSSPNVIDQHILWAAEAGIDFFSMEWCGEPGSPTDQVFRQMINSTHSDKIKFAIFYDSAINLDPGWEYDDRPDFDHMFDHRTKGQKLIDDVAYIAGEYFNHPQYLRIDGRPVVIFYPVGGWRNADPWLDRLQDEMGSLGHDIYAIADLMGWDKDDVADYPWEDWSRHFDAITGGLMHCQAVFDDPERDDFMVELERRIKEYHHEALDRGMGFIPPIMVAFDNRDPNLTVIPRDDGATMRRSWEIATQTLDDTAIAMFMTFNEWHEGTEIEPSNEYGAFYLDLLRELRASSPNEGATRCNFSLGPDSPEVVSFAF